MRGRNDAHVNLDRIRAAESFELMLLENAKQLYLHIGRHVANLIQKDRSSVSQLKSADPAIGRAGESALLMTKQFAFNETDGKRRAVYLDQRPIPALAVRVS